MGETASVLELIKKQQSSRADADFFRSLLGDYEQDVLNSSMPLILFGAGSAGQNLAELLLKFGVPVAAFCDSDTERQKGKLLGLDILSLEQLESQHQASLILVSSNKYRNQIKATLIQLGCEKIITIDSDVQCFFYTQFNKWQYESGEIEAQQQLLETVYAALSDTQSKELFIRRLAMFSGYPNYQSYVNYILEFAETCCLEDGVAAHPSEDSKRYEDQLYFDNDVFTFQPTEVLVDAGAYDGGSCLEFLQTCSQRGVTETSVYCVEADKRNFETLCSAISDLKNVECLLKGLWSNPMQLYFEGAESVSPDTAKLMTEEELVNLPQEKKARLEKIDVDSIDRLFENRPISLIKMDIEGAEYEALLGASDTIKAQKPKLAISVYHHKRDLFRIPFLVHQLCPAYKLYLRQFSNHLSEMVLLATKPE